MKAQLRFKLTSAGFYMPKAKSMQNTVPIHGVDVQLFHPLSGSGKEPGAADGATVKRMDLAKRIHLGQNENVCRVLGLALQPVRMAVLPYIRRRVCLLCWSRAMV